ncbi:hypothetical protein ABZ897_16065 [Nonomuraea sp. NPDC046802]|uniref:hypothetical protein n=1 Tax=Nonomuraea sp. NPDC046802 TaxID=3154919 RepID=UPI0034059FF2
MGPNRKDAMTTPDITPETMNALLRVLESHETEDIGWANPELHIVTATTVNDVLTITRHHIPAWKWSALLVGVIGAPGATGDAEHDLKLYADTCEPMPGFLLVALTYDNESESFERLAKRCLTAIDRNGKPYHLVREHGDETPEFEPVAVPAAAPYGDVLALLAFSLAR